MEASKMLVSLVSYNDISYSNDLFRVKIAKLPQWGETLQSK